MGTSCSCNNFSEYKEELLMSEDKIPKKDFFIDYSIDNINQKENIENNDNVLKDLHSKALTSQNNNDLGIFSTQSYTNVYNNLPIFRNNSYGTITKEVIFEEDKDNEKEVILEQDKDKEKELFIKENYDKDRELFTDIDREDEKNCKTQINLIPIKKILFNNNSNIKSSGRKTENLSSHSSYINKRKLIYSCVSDIFFKKKYKKDMISEEEYNAMPDDNYSRIIFQNINRLRNNPKKMATKIEENKKFIYTGENNQFYFKKNKIRFNLNKGHQIFDETINVLNNLEPMNGLIYNKNITINIPDNEEYINNLDYFKYQVKELQKNGNHISSFWYEKIKDPEIAFLMMVIDDNYIEPGLKRKDLLNPEIQYIGIISVEINNNFACYITLSNRK